MTVEAHLADGRVLQFPDGTDPAVIQRTVKTVIGQQAEAPPERGLLGEINHIVGGVADAAASAIPFSDEMGAGMRALVRGGTNLIQGKDADLGGTYDRALTDIRGRDKKFAGEHPYLSTGGKVLGGVVGSSPQLVGLGPNVAGMPTHAPLAGYGQHLAAAPPVSATVARSLPATIGRSAATGAGYGAVGGFAAGEDGFDNRVNSAVEGGALGAAFGGAVPAIGGVVSRVISPFRNQLTPEAQRLAQVAQTEGIPLSAAQATGSRPLHSLEGFFETHPMTASTQQAEMQAQRTAFNQAALRHIEEPGNDLSPAVLGSARNRIGGQIDNLVSQTTVRPDTQFSTDLADTVAQYGRRLDAMKKPVFDNFVSDIQDMMNSGGMPGATYQSTRSTLSSMAKSAGGSDPYFAQALRKLRDTLDDAADRAMPKHLKGDWDKARLQYGNLRTLEKAMSNTTTGAAAGNLQPTQLAQAVSQQHPRGGYARGLGPMNDLSRVGDEFVRGQIPNSGTPERLFWQDLLTNPLTLAGGYAGHAIDPTMGLLTVGGALYGPRLGQMAYNSRLGQGYLRNQVAANAGPGLRHGLLTGFAGAAGGGLLGP